MKFWLLTITPVAPSEFQLRISANIGWLKVKIHYLSTDFGTNGCYVEWSSSVVPEHWAIRKIILITLCYRSLLRGFGTCSYPTSLWRNTVIINSYTLLKAPHILVDCLLRLFALIVISLRNIIVGVLRITVGKYY